MQRYEVGRKLKDTLMGEARQGRGYFLHASTGELSCIDVLLKYFNKRCVLNGVTLNGQPVAEDPRTELTLQTRLSTPASYPSSLLQSPAYLDRIAAQSSSHIVRLYDVKDDGDSIIAIMEFCLSEDTRLLTDRGFLFLDQLRAHLTLAEDGATVEGSSVRLACYNAERRQLEYHPPSRFILKPHGHHRMVRFGREDWERDSSAVSLLVSDDHDMYGQMGAQSSEDGQVEWQRERKVKAAALLPSDAAPRASFRLLATAERGLRVEKDHLDDSDDDVLDPPVEDEVEKGRPWSEQRLRRQWLRTKARLPWVTGLRFFRLDQVRAFLGVCGFWLCDGWLERASQTINFRETKKADCTWLRCQLSACGLQQQEHISVIADQDEQHIVHVTNPRWFAFFDADGGSQSGEADQPKEDLRASSAQQAQPRPSSPTLLQSALDFDGHDSDGVDLDISPTSHDPSAKRLWPWALTLSRRRLRLLLEGCLRAGGARIRKMGSAYSIHTSSAHVRDGLIVALLHAGFTATFALACAKGTICGYYSARRRTMHSTEAYDKWSQHKRRRVEPVIAATDVWRVDFSDGNTARTRPVVRCDEDVRRVDDYHGRLWCVTVPHGLIIAQSARRDAAGVAISASRPLVVGNCHGGELFSLLSSSGASFTLSHAKAYTVQLLLALHSLHALDIVHRDISLENLLLTKDHTLRLCDFGLAREIPRQERLEEKVAVGKTRYMSPEVFSCIPYDPRLSDLWSVGVCLFVMVNKNFPWNFPHSSDPLFVMICSGRINDVMRGWGRPQLEESLVELFSHFFCPEERRWSIQQLLEAEWLRGVWNGPREGTPTQRPTTSDHPPPLHPSRPAASAPSSLSVSTAVSPASTPPAVLGAGGASPLLLSTASSEDLSANETGRPLSPAPPSSSSPPAFPSFGLDSPHLNRSMSPSFALSPSNRPSSFPQQPLFFQMQETAVMRSIDLHTPPTPLTSSLPPHVNGVEVEPSPSIQSDQLYPTPAAVEALVETNAQLPMGPTLEHSASRMDR